MFVYVHLPYCLSHCIYCDFYVELKATDDRRRAYLNALKQEITHYLSQKENPPLETLYLGGGTPGLFTADEVTELLDHLRQFTAFLSQAEITLEANPEGMASPPEAYLQSGVNRLSVGIQSMQPNELKRLSRVHSQEQAARFLVKAQQAGFSNLSIDLMYGIPEQTLDSWQDTLRQVMDLGVQHVSMYGLKVEPETGLARLIDTGRMSVPCDEDTVEMYFTGVESLQAHGYRQYEISNLAKAGHESRHNLCYWDNHEFWGFGVSAHGYIQGQRYENPRDLKAYLAQPWQRAEIHDCTREEQLENAFIFGLRKRDGVVIAQLEQEYGFRFQEKYAPALGRYMEAGFLTLEDGVLQLSPEAIPVSNEILAAFIG